MCKDDQVYVGSTKNSLEKRMQVHTRNINKCSSRQLIDLGNFKISLIEEVSDQDRYIREQYWIDQLDCVNKNKAFTTEEDIKEYFKQYREDHKEDIKQYREEHKEYFKQYREEHKEEISVQKKQYYQDHKEELLEELKDKRCKNSFTCECGKVLQEQSRSYHMNSKLHHKRMDQK